MERNKGKKRGRAMKRNNQVRQRYEDRVCLCQRERIKDREREGKR